MKNYTTQTAALKATTIYTRLLDAKQINTEKLFINGVPFDELQGSGGSGKPNQAFFTLMLVPNTETNDYTGVYKITSAEEIYIEYEYDLGGDTEPKFENYDVFIKGSETNGLLEDGIYAVITINDKFIQCIGGNSLVDSVDTLYMLNSATFRLITYNFNNDGTDINDASIEQCMMNHQIILSYVDE